MSVLAATAERLTRSDMLQALTLLLAVLFVATSISWPAGSSLVNESWFAVAPVRSALLALAAVGYGAAVAGRRRAPPPQTAPRGEALATLAALVVWALLTLPLEVIVHAASYPAVSLGWSAGVALLAVPAYFGLGLLLARLADALRASWALPLVVPASLLLLAWFDLQVGRTIFNPWTAPLAYSVPHLAAVGVGGILTLMYLVLKARRSSLAGEPA